MIRACLALVSSVLGASFLPAGDIPSGGRAALLVGNADYEGAKLPGMTESLDAVEAACRANGFRVTRHENLDKKELEDTLDKFSNGIPTNGVGLVYYFGLAAHAERFGKYYNCLRPLGAAIRNDGDYRSRGVPLLSIVEALSEKSGARRSLVFVDGCWASPILPKSDKLIGGLRQFAVPKQTSVMFAAPSGKTSALPTESVASPAATALAKHLGEFDASSKSAAEKMASDLGGAWFSTTTEAGIGKRPEFPVAESLREGKTAGEGFTNSTGMAFRWCPPGRFRMGSTRSDSASTRDRKPVDVTLSSGFWLGEYEVTQREYSLVVRKNLPRGFTLHPNAPYWGTSDAKGITDFCKKLTDIEKKAGRLPAGWEYTGPTEAEWEYACRAGSTSAYCFGDSIDRLGEFGNFADKALLEANPNYTWADLRADDGVGESLALVGSYRPNAWGLRDMHGNVAELVLDSHQVELPGGTDPLVQKKKDAVPVIRGGAWCSLPLYCESSFRNMLTSRDKPNFVGFRIVLKKR